MPRTPAAPSNRSGAWASVQRTALSKVLVMGVAGVFGLINTRIIIGHFGTDAYAQNGLLATFPSLMPFTDLGIGAVILNTVAGSEDLPRDAVVRRTLTTAVRVLLISSLVIATAGVVLGLLGAWPALLGEDLMDGGGATATACLLVYAAALPLSVGQRIIVGMGRSATQVISTGVVSPALTCMLLAAVVARLDAGNAVPVMSYLANTLVSLICIVVAWRATRPLLADAMRDVPRLRAVRGVRIIDTAGPQLFQSLVIPIAFQTDRLLLSHLGEDGSLAQYNLAAQLFNLLTQTVAVTGVAMWPHFAKARARGRIESPFAASAAFAGLGGALGLLLALLSPWAARVLSDGAISLPAALLAANFVLNAQKDGAHVLARATGLLTPLLTMTASEKFLKAHPDRVQAVVAAHDEAWQWIQAHREEAIALGARLQNVSEQEARQLYDWTHFTQRLRESDFRALKADMQFILNNGMMRNRVDVRALVAPAALDGASAQ